MLNQTVRMMICVEGGRVERRQYATPREAFIATQRWQEAPKCMWLRVYIDHEKVYEWTR